MRFSSEAGHATVGRMWMPFAAVSRRWSSAATGCRAGAMPFMPTSFRRRRSHHRQNETSSRHSGVDRNDEQLRRIASASLPFPPTARRVRPLDRPAASLAAQLRLQRTGLLLALVAQLEVVAPALGRQFATVERGLHRAARFAAVAAVGEAAGLGQLLDVGEQVEVLLAG